MGEKEWDTVDVVVKGFEAVVKAAKVTVEGGVRITAWGINFLAGGAFIIKKLIEIGLGEGKD